MPTQKVLVLQGGALGAYEASVGAVNATLLVKHLVRTGSWRDSNLTLRDFWLKGIGKNENSFSCFDSANKNLEPLPAKYYQYEEHYWARSDFDR
jgi:hypothetical protein